MVVDVAEQQTAFGSMHDQTDVEIDADGPEAVVAGFFQLVEVEAGMGGIDLQVEGGELCGFLFVIGQPRQAVGERIGEYYIHFRIRDPIMTC